MSYTSSDERRARAAAEAAEWALKLDAEELSETLRSEFVDWLRESPLHVAELLRVGQLTAVLADYSHWPDSPARAELDDRNIVSLPRFPIATPSAAATQKPRSWRMASLAAVFAAMCIGGLLLYQHTDSNQIQTHAAERREIVLEDGSVVRLSPSTRLRVDMQAHVRAIALEQGEAAFRVAKNPDRPFIVSAARARVQAIGTFFTVTRSADNVVVTVAEGKVAVAASIAGNRGSHTTVAPISLQANERVSISPVGIASEVRRVEVARVQAWDDTQLAFENIAVAEVVAQFNRRNRMQIRIADAALANRTVSGIFDANDPRSFVDFLTAIAGASSTSTLDSIVVVSGTAGAAPEISAR